MAARCQGIYPCLTILQKHNFCRNTVSKVRQDIRLYKARLQPASNLSMGLTRVETLLTTGLCTDKAGDDVTDDWSQVDGEVGTIGCETSSLVRMYAASH